MLVRRIARPLLASVFIVGGVDTLRNPKPRAQKAESVATTIAEPLPLPKDPEQLVKINAGAQVGAGLLLALGRLPRVAALTLAVSTVPTTLAGHPFWQETDAATRKQQQMHFFKNLSVLGGLLIAAADTGGKPSLGWRARHAAKRAKQSAKLAERLT